MDKDAEIIRLRKENLDLRKDIEILKKDIKRLKGVKEIGAPNKSERIWLIAVINKSIANDWNRRYGEAWDKHKCNKDFLGMTFRNFKRRWKYITARLYLINYPKFFLPFFKKLNIYIEYKPFQTYTREALIKDGKSKNEIDIILNRLSSYRSDVFSLKKVRNEKESLDKESPENEASEKAINNTKRKKHPIYMNHDIYIRSILENFSLDNSDNRFEIEYGKPFSYYENIARELNESFPINLRDKEHKLSLSNVT
jgi:hypothetical protein